ncbi:MAG: hypothetical protein JSV03_03340 [Planctomycetota bacterium]|nr:MAG: hypothetical protein JSV03_03340 [Planctomycetota bacterium]
MKAYYQVNIVSSVLFILLSIGCSHAPKEIPTGVWSGQGTYVDYEAVMDKKKSRVLQDKSNNKQYDTSLKINKRTILGHDTLYFEIHSKRGRLFNIEGTETHLEFALFKLKALDNGSILYAIIDNIPSSDDEEARKDFAKAISFASAMCVHRDGATVLQLWYVPGGDGCFSDTMIFEGPGLRKIGHVLEAKDKSSKPKLMEVYWVEELRKIK